MKQLLILMLLAGMYACKKSSNDEVSPTPSNPAGSGQSYSIKGTWTADSITKNDTTIASGSILNSLSHPLTDSLIITASNFTAYEVSTPYVYTWDTLTADTIKLYQPPDPNSYARYGYTLNQNSLIVKLTTMGDNYKYYFRRR